MRLSRDINLIAKKAKLVKFTDVSLVIKYTEMQEKRRVWKKMKNILLYEHLLYGHSVKILIKFLTI